VVKVSTLALNYEIIKAKKMTYNRRKFLVQGAGLISGLALTSFAQSPLVNTLGGNDADAIGAFGLQLWSVRDDMAKDPKGTLKQLASYGYKQIESFEGKDGIYWGMTAKQFKKYMDSLGMKLVSSHCDISKDFEQKANDAAAIGVKYLICPWKGPQKSLDDFKKFADEFNACGEICRKAGIRFAYHNHDYSFKELEGKLPQDLMMENTDAATVDYEMDMYWVVTAGHDPIAWMKKYPNRFRACHIKDRTRNVSADEKDASCVLGKGSIDYAKVLKAAQKQGMKYFIVEQEKFVGTTPMQAVKANAGYMKKLKV
jgi:sugar phosphate isomerase/epimerase